MIRQGIIPSISYRKLPLIIKCICNLPVFFCFLLVCAAFVASFGAGKLTVATEICEFKSSTRFFWLNSKDLLLLEVDKSKDALNNDAKAFKYDIVTKKRTFLPRLTSVLQGSLIYHGDIDVSPDGMWILWQDEDTGIRTVTVDGQKLKKWHGNWHTDEVHWMHDSLSWLALKEAWLEEPFHSAIVYAVKPPFSQSKLPLGTKILRTTRKTRQVASDGFLYNWNWETGQTEHKLMLNQYSLRPTIRELRSCTVQIPTNWRFEEAIFVPQLKRFAVILYCLEAQNKHHEIWTVSLDQTQEIIKIRVDLPHTLTGEPGDQKISQLKTIASSSRLSFIFENKLMVTTELK